MPCVSKAAAVRHRVLSARPVSCARSSFEESRTEPRVSSVYITAVPVFDTIGSADGSYRCVLSALVGRIAHGRPPERGKNMWDLPGFVAEIERSLFKLFSALFAFF